MPYPAFGARVVTPSRVALVHTEHNLWDRYHPVTRWANALTYSRNRAVIAVSQAVASTIRPPRWQPGTLPPVEVIRYGADLGAVRSGDAARTEARRRLGLDSSALVVGSVANFTEKKDQRTLLGAVAELAPELPELRVVLIGTGPLEDELRASTRFLGIEERVLFTGIRDDVYELLPGFDVFALSSRYEGLPISLLEAMASGVACVTTRVGGIPEVITNGVEGLMVEPGSPTAFAGALREVLGSTTRRKEIGRCAAQRAQQFDLRRATARTQETYRRCLAP
jgi:glycosyltransferase involved in cell wall biosynthesis